MVSNKSIVDVVGWFGQWLATPHFLGAFVPIEVASS
jgi:hypothetical protein